MYHCLKCARNHRQSSNIGRWHQELAPPELPESLNTNSTPTPEQWSAILAVGLELHTTSSSEVPLSAVKETWNKRFATQFDAGFSELFQSADDTYRIFIVRRHSGRTWVGLEATTTSHVRIKQGATSYLRLGKTPYTYTT
jgi:hypothetical protein